MVFEYVVYRFDELHFRDSSYDTYGLLYVAFQVQVKKSDDENYACSRYVSVVYGHDCGLPYDDAV